RQDFDKALAIGPTAPVVEPERVLVFLVETDCAVGAGDLVGIAHLPPCRDTAEEDRAHGAAGKPADEMRLVFIGDGLRPAGAGPGGAARGARSRGRRRATRWDRRGAVRH